MGRSPLSKIGRSCSLACSLGAGRSGPEDFVGLTGLAAPALLGWGLRVTVCAWSVSVWVGPRLKIGYNADTLSFLT